MKRDAQYRRVWRWHLYAGVLVAPVLVIVALTGLGYIFKHDVNAWLHADVLFTDAPSVASQDDELPLTLLVAAAEASKGSGWRASGVRVEADPTRRFAISLRGPERARERLYVDQYTGRVVGPLPGDAVFPVLLKLHRSLFAGKVGRLLTEMTASWAVLLALSGVYLWWPRGEGRLGAALFKRFTFAGFDGLKRSSLLEAHGVVGLWAAPLVVVIAVTGLFYSPYWGKGFSTLREWTGSRELLPDLPETASTATPASDFWQATLRLARERAPGCDHTIRGPGKPGKPVRVFSAGEVGPSVSHVMAIDPAGPRVLAARRFSELPLLAQWSMLNYRLHTGEVLGTASKLVYAAVMIGLAGLPVTGVWMWHKRRPPGRTGVPKRANKSMPKWMAAVALAGACLLPVAGVSIAAVAAFDLLIGRRLLP
ncbi:MAG: PepSY domain-containing protein [Planctomycetota bacterium]